MAHGVRGLPPVGFGMTVYPEPRQVPDVVRWAIGMRGLVGGVSFITYRAAVRKGFDYLAGATPVDPWTGLGYLAETAEDINVRSTDVSAVIAEAFPGSRPRRSSAEPRRTMPGSGSTGCCCARAMRCSDPSAAGAWS